MFSLLLKDLISDFYLKLLYMRKFLISIVSMIFPLRDTISGNVTESNHIFIAVWFHIYLTDIKSKENKRLRYRKTYLELLYMIYMKTSLFLSF